MECHGSAHVFFLGETVQIRILKTYFSQPNLWYNLSPSNILDLKSSQVALFFFCWETPTRSNQFGRNPSKSGFFMFLQNLFPWNTFCHILGMTPYFFGTFPNFLPPPKKNHVPLSDQSYMSKTGIGLLLQPRNHDFDPPSRYSKASRRLPARNSTILSVRFDSFAALFVNESLHFVKSCYTKIT